MRDADANFGLVDEVADRFGAPDRECIVRAEARSGDLFDGPSLAALRAVAERLGRVDGVDRVRSMFDVRRQGAAGAILPVIPHVDGELGTADREAARDRATDHPLIAGHMLAADARSAILLVRLRADADRQPRLTEVVAAIDAELHDAQAATSPLTLELTGLPALRDQAARALRRDMVLFNSIGLVLAIAVSAWVARSLRSTLVASVPPAVGAIWAMGIIGLCGVPLNILTSVVPSLALVVGTCDSIHFIEDMRRSTRRGVTGAAASTGAIRRVGAACGLTSLVTAIGFASLAAARIEAVRTFGLAAAAGAVASFLAVTMITPLLASAPGFSGARLGRSSRRIGRLANRLAACSVRNARPLALTGCVATLLLAVAGTGLDADLRIVDALPQDAAAARALARVDAEFGGTTGVDVVVRWPAGLGWLDDQVLASLADVHGVLERSGGMNNPLSLGTVARTLPSRARRRLDPSEFTDMVDEAARTAIVRVRVRDVGTRALDRVYGGIEDGLEELTRQRPGWSFELTGMSVFSARNIRQLIRDLGGSLLLEVAVIGGILAVAFRSPLAGIVSLVPNVFPLAVIAALLVATGRALDPATVIVFNVCLGLAVDDTVHLLAAVQRHRREGVAIAGSVRRAVAETGNAVVLGGVVLALGFVVVTLSSVPSLARFGMLACAAVAAATLAELVFLPALLVATGAMVRRRPDMVADGIFGAAPFPWPAADHPAGATGKLAG